MLIALALIVPTLLLARVAAWRGLAICIERAQIRVAFERLLHRRSLEGRSQFLPEDPQRASQPDRGSMAISGLMTLGAASCGGAIWLVGAVFTLTIPGALFGGAAAGWAWILTSSIQPAGALTEWMGQGGARLARRQDHLRDVMLAIGAQDAFVRNATRQLGRARDQLLAATRLRAGWKTGLVALGLVVATGLILATTSAMPRAEALIALATGVRGVVFLREGLAGLQLARAFEAAPTPLSAPSTSSPWIRRDRIVGPAHVALSSVLLEPAKPGASRDDLGLTFEAGVVTLVVSDIVTSRFLIRKLLALESPRLGDLVVDGVVLRGDALGWRAQCAYVPSTTLLMAGSLKDNLRMVAPAATESSILTSLNAVGLGHLARPNGDGLGVRLGRSGLPLTPAEARRLSLARALLRSPRLLLVEETAQPLPLQDHAEIDRLLSALREWCTVVIFSSGLRPLPLATQVAIMEDRRVVEEGAVDALLACPTSRLSTMVAAGGAYRASAGEGGASDA